jgi:hypothetical protein
MNVAKVADAGSPLYILSKLSKMDYLITCAVKHKYLDCIG